MTARTTRTPPRRGRRLPARVYWIRRGVLLAVLALLIGGIGFGLKALGGGSEQPLTATNVAQTKQSKQAASPGAGQPTGGSTAGAGLASPSGTCDPADIVVTPAIGRITGGARTSLKFKVTGAEAACAWRVSPETLVVKITSGSDRIWSSQQCPKAIPTGDIVVRNAVPTKIFVSWSTRRSEEGCPMGTTAWARAGYYHAIAAAMGGQPTDVQFRLGVPPTPTKTVITHPKPKKKAHRTPSDTPTPTASPTESPTATSTR